jgi:hypothetical protein
MSDSEREVIISGVMRTKSLYRNYIMTRAIERGNR